MKHIKGLECPGCGKEMLEARREDIQLQSNGQPYTVKDLEFWQCTNCGERMFSTDSVTKIQASSPAFKSSRRSPTAKKKGVRKLSAGTQP